VKGKAIAKYVGPTIASVLISGVVHARQFVCTAGVVYSFESDGKLRIAEDSGRSRKVFTVDTSTGLLQGDQVLPLGSYTVVYAGTATDGARLIRNEAARLAVLFVATNVTNPHPFLFTDGVTTITGTCRPSS
jgi:hypothetical protein